ncbi:hypothetical protein B0H63DRAFT_211918 [Podospora didyma]|uniref:Uncharacterized protein n=1 Tax=Podospora didyma TaxID=330526 RepID=A0AAE0NHL2_9PEZI|nr:hypothetical protein B0H63DRAFT_211918 [Podospora didyma]
MLAPSPLFFDGCRNTLDTRPEGRSLARSQFAISNRGIQFTAPDILISNNTSTGNFLDYYFLPLNCSTRENNTAQATPQRRLLLKKVGPGLYVRAATPRDLDLSTTPLMWPNGLERDICILPKVTPDMYSALDLSHQFGIEIRSPLGPDHLLVKAEPREAWDITGRETDFFVMTFLFCRGVDVGGNMELKVYLVHPDVWTIYDAPEVIMRRIVYNATERQKY